MDVLAGIAQAPSTLIVMVAATNRCDTRLRVEFPATALIDELRMVPPDSR
jgi:hypothetical protein